MLGAIGHAEPETDCFDAPVAQQDIGDFIAARGRIDDVPALEQ
jgi:hypothetical protein